MTEQEQKAFDQMREALKAVDRAGLELDEYVNNNLTSLQQMIDQALTAANAVSHPQATEPQAHYEEQPDGTVIPVDPSEVKLVPVFKVGDWVRQRMCASGRMHYATVTCVHPNGALDVKDSDGNQYGWSSSHTELVPGGRAK